VNQPVKSFTQANRFQPPNGLAQQKPPLYLPYSGKLKEDYWKKAPYFGKVKVGPKILLKR